MKAWQSDKAVFRDEHFELFSLADHPWPVDLASLDSDLYAFDFRLIGERAAEEIDFLRSKFEPQT